MNGVKWRQKEVEVCMYGVGGWVGRECEDSYKYKSKAGRCTSNSEYAQK